MSDLPPFPVPALHQVGVIVRDLEQAMRNYWERFAIGPWRVYTYGPPLVKEMTYHGRRQDYRMRIALCWVGPLMIELIQPLEGPSIYEDFLREHGEGPHHVLTYVDDFDAAVRGMAERGYAMLQSGRGYGVHGDGGYAYFDTVAELGLILEVSQVPTERVPPELIYPAQ